MRVILSLLALLLTLSSCWSIPVDVSFATDPRVLRGTWTGTLEKGCVNNLNNATFSPDGTRFFVMSFSEIEIFDAMTANKLGGFTATNLKSPVVWSSDNTNLIFLRKPESSALERVVVNALDGTEVSRITYTEEFLGEIAGFNADLTSLTVTLTSGVTGVIKASRYDLLTGTLVKSLVLPNKGNLIYKVNPDGTKLSYQIRDTTQQVWVANFTTETITKEFDVLAQETQHQFTSDTGIVVFYTPDALPNQTVIRRINLSNSSSQETTIPRVYQVVLSPDVSRYAFVQNDTLFIKNFETGVTIAQKPMQSTTTDPSGSFSYPSSGFVVSSNANGTIWVVSGTKVGCTLRIFETTQQSFSSNLNFASSATKIVTMTFVPTYVSSSSYNLTGTMKIANAVPFNIKGVVSLPTGCSVFSGTCENLKPSALPPMPYYNQFEINHFVNLTDENNQSLGFNTVIVGKRKDNKKIELFGLQNSQGQPEVLRLNPIPTP
jgi:hypothetical protein